MAPSRSPNELPRTCPAVISIPVAIGQFDLHKCQGHQSHTLAILAFLSLGSINDLYRTRASGHFTLIIDGGERHNSHELIARQRKNATRLLARFSEMNGPPIVTIAAA